MWPFLFEWSRFPLLFLCFLLLLVFVHGEDSKQLKFLVIKTTITCDVKVMVELSEFLFFNIEEKVVHVEVVCTNSQLPIQVKQLKNRPGMTEDKLLFQVVLLCQQDADQHVELVKTNLAHSIPVQHVKHNHDLCPFPASHMTKEVIEQHIC